MFGYVRPFRPELKCRDFDLYRATYCGLCRCLRRQYGPVAPMLLNFDFTFLTLLLWEPEDAFTPCRGRCHANPLRKMPMCPNSSALDLAAAESLVLAWWKLRDDLRDNGLWKRLPAWTISLALGPAYRKAARRCPEFDRAVQGCLEELSALEREGCSSLDRTADTFARLLQSAAPQDGERGRVLSQLLYHLGRWIYLADAQDDLEEDKLAGRYNPVSARYGPMGDPEALARTMNHSLALVGAALQLGEFGCRKPLLENIVYLGLPLVQRAVFDGSWKEIKKQKIWRNDT
ncbi:MAG: hypothetical protein HFF44_01565 [Lawsonibacter sp.]|nr:hypothetical protein [Lawsonibacter sp.]